MSVKFSKKDFRDFAKKHIKKRAKISAKCAFYSINDALLKLIKKSRARKILLYLPLNYEPDVYKLRRNLARKCEIYSTYMVDVKLKMVKLRLPFEVAKFNIRQSNGKKIGDLKLDLAVVPVIGVDENFARIGQGKGFYDRLFAEFKKMPKMIVFTQISDFFIKQNLALKHDICGDIYITPRKIYIKKERDNGSNRAYCKHNNSRGGSLGWLNVCKKDKRCKL